MVRHICDPSPRTDYCSLRPHLKHANTRKHTCALSQDTSSDYRTRRKREVVSKRLNQMGKTDMGTRG